MPVERRSPFDRPMNTRWFESRNEKRWGDRGSSHLVRSLAGRDHARLAPNPLPALSTVAAG